MSRPKDWPKLIEDWRVSGLSQSAYCRQQQLSLSSFNTHLRKLKPNQGFVEVTGAKTNERVEIVIDDRLLIRLPRDISASRLSELVQCLI